MVRLPASEWLDEQTFNALADKVERHPDCSNTRLAILASIEDPQLQSEELLRMAQEYGIRVDNIVHLN
jgi:hypothetical protein